MIGTFGEYLSERSSPVAERRLRGGGNETAEINL